MKYIILILLFLVSNNIFNNAYSKNYIQDDNSGCIDYFEDIKDMIEDIKKNAILFDKYIAFYNSSGNTIIIIERDKVFKDLFFEISTKERTFKLIKTGKEYNDSRLYKFFSTGKEHHKFLEYNMGGNKCGIVVFDGLEKRKFCFNILNDTIPLSSDVYTILLNKMFYEFSK